jgi:hypothetical protein
LGEGLAGLFTAQLKGLLRTETPRSETF